MTEGEEPMVITVTKKHHVARASLDAKKLALSIGLSRAEAYRVATAVSELATNLVAHTPEGGSITLRTISGERGVGIEVLVEDQGPGIANVEEALQDGFSTDGGLGGGLPGVGRLMDEFELSSSQGEGTRIIARKWKK